MKVKAVMEYNEGGYLIYLEDFVGAYVRGRSREEALAKMDSEIRQYLSWAGGEAQLFGLPFEPEIVQTKKSALNVSDADSDVIFDSEKTPLTAEEYASLKKLAMKSAEDFLCLYDSVPDKLGTALSPRKTFYGDVPITAEQMYAHTKNVNSYYFSEIGVRASNEPDIAACREAGFSMLEAIPGFLENKVFDGSYNEQWSLRKVCRRFVWHDRIHAKAMFRMAAKLCGRENIQNPFRFL